MKIEVILAKNTPNEEGLPDLWPSICYEIDDKKEVKLPHLKMTNSELEEYKNSHKSAYLKWENDKKSLVQKHEDVIKQKRADLIKSIKLKLFLTDDEMDILCK